MPLSPRHINFNTLYIRNFELHWKKCENWPKIWWKSLKNHQKLSKRKNDLKKVKLTKVCYELLKTKLTKNWSENTKTGFKKNVKIDRKCGKNRQKLSKRKNDKKSENWSKIDINHWKSIQNYKKMLKISWKLTHKL